MLLTFLMQQGDTTLAYGGSEPDDDLQIEFNMKLTATFAQCAT